MLLHLLLLGVQGNCWSVICLKRVTRESELPDSFEIKERGCCFEGSYNYRAREATGVGFRPESLVFSLMAQFLGKLLFFLARQCHHLLCKHHPVGVSRVPREEQNIRNNT